MCIVNRFTFSAVFTHSVRHVLSYKFAMIRFFNVCIARSTTPVPVSILGVLYSISMFFPLQNSSYSFVINAPIPPLSVFLFSGSPYMLKFCFRKFITSLISDDFQIFAVGLLLNLSMAISIWCSPFKFLLFSSPEKSI